MFGRRSVTIQNHFHILKPHLPLRLVKIYKRMNYYCSSDRLLLLLSIHIWRHSLLLAHVNYLRVHWPAKLGLSEWTGVANITSTAIIVISRCFKKMKRMIATLRMDECMWNVRIIVVKVDTRVLCLVTLHKPLKLRPWVTERIGGENKIEPPLKDFFSPENPTR